MERYYSLLPPVRRLPQELQDKVIKCWELARSLGGWSFDDLENVPFTLLIPGVKVSLVAHTIAVSEVAMHSARVLKESYSEIKINEDYLLAGALLHDVGKLLEYEKSVSGVVQSREGKLLRHPFSGANLAFSVGLPTEVVHIIATHAKEGDSGFRSIESILVHHADFINFESLKVAYEKAK